MSTTTNTKIIRKADIENKFSILFPNSPEENLVLDFNPFIEKFNLKGNFCLLHYQARPKGIRSWGVYYHKEYYSPSEIETALPLLTLTLEDNGVFIPHAVLCAKIVTNFKVESFHSRQRIIMG